MRSVLSFFKEFKDNSMTVGSIFPSTSYLAEALAKNLKTFEGPKRIIEIGPGTGPITEGILKHVKPGDTFHLVEVNESFCELLNKMAENEWKEQLEGVDFKVHCCFMEEIGLEHKFDFVISGLPLNNFKSDVIQSILTGYQNLLTDNGKLSYFEYLYVRKIKEKLNVALKRQVSMPKYKLLNSFVDAYQVDTDEVFLNFPPAIARHFAFR
ncbi:MAG: methyltransferase domain-containing protein [Candidatus Cloacimonetes bacterium]|nr:methyltransferase domain-containing protein [Candidatus Cloacimonadota bacterium]